MDLSLYLSQFYIPVETRRLQLITINVSVREQSRLQKPSTILKARTGHFTLDIKGFVESWTDRLKLILIHELKLILTSVNNVQFLFMG